MKNIFIVLLMLMAPCLTRGQSVFVLDGASGTRVYNHIDSALKYALDGDYLYLPAGNIQKPDGLMIKKRLNIFGAGHYPDSTAATGTTTINGNLYFWKESSGSTLQGIFLFGTIYFGTDPVSAGAKNILIQRCSFTSLYLSENGSTFRGSENIFITQNVIRESVFFAEAKNVELENNIVEGALHYASGQVRIANNIFLRRVGNAFYAMQSARVENNIFMSSASFFGPSCGGLEFLNNVFKEGNPLGGNYAINNLFDVANLFTNQSGTSFLYQHNYRLKADSPAKNAGKDGKDCGIYGGNNPYKDGAVPANPHIRSKNLPSQTDAQGKINVQVTVAAQNN